MDEPEYFLFVSLYLPGPADTYVPLFDYLKDRAAQRIMTGLYRMRFDQRPEGDPVEDLWSELDKIFETFDHNDADRWLDEYCVYDSTGSFSRGGLTRY